MNCNISQGPAAEVAGQEANATDGTGEAEVEAEGGGGEEDDEEEDSDDEDLVTIDINQQQIQDVTRRHQTFGLNKAVRQIPGAGEKKGKFAVEEFEQVGTVNGKPAHEFDIETLEDKPWRKPGENNNKTQTALVTFYIFVFYFIRIHMRARMIPEMSFIHLKV